MATYRLTIRRGPKVTRTTFDRLGEALEAMRAEAESVRAEGPLDEVKMIRTYEPQTRVAARLEISSGGLLGGNTAGIDVMGDGRVVAFQGGVLRRELDPRGGQTPYDAVKRAMK